MTYLLTEEQRSIQDLVRRVAREKVAPRADEIDRTAQYPQDMFDLLRELGSFALPFPAEYGGTGSLLSGMFSGRRVRPRLLQHGLLARRSMGRVRRFARGSKRRTEATFSAWPCFWRTARSLLDDGIAERFGCVGHQDACDASSGRLQAQWLEDLVHEFRHRQFRARRRQVHER